MMKGYIRLSASDSTTVIVVNKTAEELIAMGYYPVVTADSTEILYRKA